MKEQLKQYKISIIIPSYNQGQFIEETLQSIISQNYKNVEIIIMDGGSTDNTVEIIKKYEQYITYWQSQKDNGQSAAINEGIARATGEFVTWLNSDDVLIPGALFRVNQQMNRYPSVDWFLGNCVWIDKYSNVIRVGKVEVANNFFNIRHIFSNGGPSAFMRKATFKEIGALREDFHYMMDTELWHRFVAKGHMFKRIPCYCWGLRLHEDAKMSGHNFQNSALADKNHPSWIQKKKENTFLRQNYPLNEIVVKLWRLLKVLTHIYPSRISDRKYLNKSYTKITNA